MLPVAQHLLQTASIKRFVSVSNRGDTTYSAPADLACRFQPSTKRLVDADGEQVVSNAVLYVIDQTITAEDAIQPPGASRWMTPIRVDHFFDLLTGAYSYSSIAI